MLASLRSSGVSNFFLIGSSSLLRATSMEAFRSPGCTSWAEGIHRGQTSTIIRMHWFELQVLMPGKPSHKGRTSLYLWCIGTEIYPSIFILSFIHSFISPKTSAPYLFCKVLLHFLKHSVDLISAPLGVPLDAELWNRKQDTSKSPDV